MGGIEVLIYGLLFIGLYFEVFVLLTFLSGPARERRARPLSTRTPHVAMIVPCWNEEPTIKGNVESLLTLDYPEDRLEIIVVNDGSTDRSGEILDEAFADHPRVKIIHQLNGGKHAALNTGIEYAKDAELVGCLDADSYVEKSALREIISCFDDPRVAAATVAMSVHDPKKPLEVMQHVEYILGIALRHVMSAVNGIYVTPGPFSLYRRAIVLKVGGFRFGHQTEDMEMALRLQREGYWIENAPKARVYTKVPASVRGLIKQRTRWTSGFLRNVAFDYRGMIANPRFGVLGLMVLPLGFLAILGGIVLFGMLIFSIVDDVVQGYLVHRGIPFSYTFSQIPHEWFFIPLSVLSVLAIVSSAGIILFIIIGKRVSNTPAKLFTGILAYTLIFRLIAPLWLLRSLKDVALGTKRPWR
ncbi:MAG: poly-beta,6-N-acetyl-D-glucosamine synthase [Candidatus Parcubacteria bacterium]|jgi:cellulose synthase/poly-beta-1,6-N-acetylglucosamine synthase-like glycosyltransferase|nr:poly-beta,6-N-acetyl-D-glucosamine synthase [Candidatus Parcubacteria bacterium]